MAEKTGLRPIVFVRWAGVVLWAGVIVFMSSQTSTDINAGLGFFSEIARILRTVEESIFGSGVD
ncbi:MAG: hypothetical protein RR619_05075, partial [Raoultibacter sp.]